MNTRKKIKIMGILNVTPDSFYDGGAYTSVDSALRRAVDMAEEGADIIDIGGESTRPGSESVSMQEEMDRVCPVIEKIAREISLPLSVDTNKADVALAAVKSGASMINDISGLTFDSRMAGVAASTEADLVIMHIKGTPPDMQKNTVYSSLIEDVLDFLLGSVKIALEHGVDRKRIIIDPGIGFGKSLEQNYRIIKNLYRFCETGYPVLIGLSRKSLIGKLYTNEEDRLPATIALNAVAAFNGADLLRVHDVKAHKLAMGSVDFLNRMSD